MSAKKPANTYIVQHRGKSADRGCTVFGRYRIGAKNEKEAEALLREVVGKHAKVKVYYKVTDSAVVSRGTVIKEC